MFLKVKKDMLRHQESPGVISDTTRLHKTLSQEVDVLKIHNCLSVLGLMACLLAFGGAGCCPGHDGVDGRVLGWG